jgi:trehalose 6-phosphate synthase
MNLVCKEYVTVQEARKSSGLLVLSEFTGAAEELPQAVLCNPFDTEGLSYRIEQALRLPAEVRRAAISDMASYVRKHDVHRWVAEQLSDIASRGGKDANAGR